MLAALCRGSVVAVVVTGSGWWVFAELVVGVLLWVWGLFVWSLVIGGWMNLRV